MDAWEQLTSTSTITKGDAWEHLHAQGGGIGEISVVVLADGLEVDVMSDEIIAVIDDDTLEVFVEDDTIEFSIELDEITVEINDG
jgi:hypothetical protein